MSVYVFLADGFEEVEAVTPIDFLRRAEIELRTVSVGASNTVVGGHDIVLQTDCHISDLDAFIKYKPHALVCPGGVKGAERLAACNPLLNFLRNANSEGIVIAAICAAPALVLGKAGADILASHRFTCYPGFESRAASGIYVSERLVCDENIITAVAASAAAEFSLAIITALKGRAVAEAVSTSIIQRDVNI